MENLTIDQGKIERLRLNKKSGYEYKKRRQEDWREIYTLYRDKPQINRLTQRQSVHVPLMKQTIRTILKDIDDMPVMEFENLDDDKQAELFQNEYWKHTLEYNQAELKDIIDKKQEQLFGRSFDQWQIEDGMCKFNIIDPEDMLVDRYTNPANLDTARFLIHTNIFKPLSVIEDDDMYDKEAVAELKRYYSSNMGIVKAADNTEMLTEKNRKMSAMGLQDVDSPKLGETYVALSMHFVFEKLEGEDEEQIVLYVEADSMKILLRKPLEKVIGVTKDHYWRTHYPYNSWADDVENQDFWSGSTGDIVRTPNKILDSYMSQLVENRTLRNFGMHYYDSSLEGFEPQTYNPVPWGWFGIPVPQGGKITDIIQKVDIPDLSESIDEMQYIETMIEKATGATATQQGVQTETQITLGEVKLALGQAQERVKGIAKFYTPVWKQRAEKFLKLIEAAPDKLDAVKVYKKGRNTNAMYGREIAPKDYMTDSGYRVQIWSQEEKNADDSRMLERLSATVQNIPNNPKLMDIYQRKLLEFSGLKPDEITEVMEVEEQRRQMIADMMAQGGMMPQDQMGGQPQMGAPQPQAALPPPQAPMQ